MRMEIFEQIGFTNAETKVYLGLLKTGKTTAGPLLDVTGLQNSTLHKILHSLLNKGFISFIIKSKTRYYQASDPENILKSIKEKETKFESLLPELKNMQKPIEKQEAEVYEGFTGLKNMLYELIKDGKKGDEYLFFAFYTQNPDDFDNVYNFYKEFEKERVQRGLVVKGIAPSNIKDKFIGRNMKKVKFVNFPVPMNISVFQNKVIFTPWEEGQVSFLFHSRQMAESFRKYFYSVYGK
ncbi:MAG: helix-turn-helix domain-containing protein [archaeon]